MPRYWVHSAPEDYTEAQRECARSERCSDPRVMLVDGRNTRLPALTYRAFCDVDRTMIQKALRDLPALYVRLRGEIGTKGQAVGPKVSSSKSAPIPINLAVDELLTELWTVLTSWHERVATVAHLTATAPDFLVCCAILAAHVDVLLALPEEPMGRSLTLHDAAKLPPRTVGLVHRSAEYADVILHLDGARAGLEVLNLHYRARRLLGETKPPARHLNGVYCDCGFAELYEVLDDDGQPAGAKCRECGNEYDRDGYADLVAVRAEPVKTYRRRPLQPAAADDAVARRA